MLEVLGFVVGPYIAMWCMKKGIDNLDEDDLRIEKKELEIRKLRKELAKLEDE